MKHSKVEVFHGKDLDSTVDKAVEKCPMGYEIIDFDVSFVNSEWIVIAKIDKETGMQVEMFSDWDINQLERDIADFLEDNPDIKIKHVTHSSASFGTSDDQGIATSIAIWYKEE
ncbi:hypothetical protein [Enterococcus sp. BWR-S5]|uniref:hypothetical protein n=1 Tax=Enterococcus sp. BWR-S5 TaxID=2787714 RepID=UPI0019208CBF|nr:hypothetical protein [Enterococcus sp. BWR-S5]MBL1223720.1 hypothetical protein [Enterococcus sp. BWR-S5]